MILKMKCGIRGCSLCQENGETLGYVTRRICHGRALDIWDASRQLNGQLRGIENGIQWETPDGYRKQAQFQYRQDKDGKPLQLSLIRPPMPIGLTLETQWGELHLTQTDQREYQIYLDQKPLGEIQHILHKNKKIRTDDRTSAPPQLYCLSYAIAWFLLQDDRIEI